MAGVGQLEGGLDARHAAADYQRRLGDRHGELLLRLEVAGASDGAGDQIHGLTRRGRSVPRMHPRAVLAQVGHFHQVRIEAGFTHALPKGGLVLPWSAGCDHHAVELVCPDRVLDLVLPRVGAGVFVPDRADHARERLGVLGDGGAVDGPGDIEPAVADEDTDADLFLSWFGSNH